MPCHLAGRIVIVALGITVLVERRWPWRLAAVLPICCFGHWLYGLLYKPFGLVPSYIHPMIRKMKSSLNCLNSNMQPKYGIVIRSHIIVGHCRHKKNYKLEIKIPRTIFGAAHIGRLEATRKRRKTSKRSRLIASIYLGRKCTSRIAMYCMNWIYRLHCDIPSSRICHHHRKNKDGTMGRLPKWNKRNHNGKENIWPAVFGGTYGNYR